MFNQRGKFMKKLLTSVAAIMLIAPAAMAAEWSPYVGLGLVIDKAGTSAKRMGLDSTMRPVENAGGDMQFDMAMAGEFTAGVKYGHFRAEVEVALRGAAEDDYDLAHISAGMASVLSLPGAATVETSTSVKHNSYLLNAFYDFSIDGSKWTPYVGAGLGVGTYKQTASVEMDFENDLLPDTYLGGIDQTKTAFEYQVMLGAAYSFDENWALDLGYRFNAATVGGEFVYAHELKIGARYAF
jgi:opacity protein-like surface antigen